MDSIFENLYVNRELQSSLFASVCSKYQLTRTELLVLLFLGKNARNTATDIVENLKIAKSHVSASVHDLEERGFVRTIAEPDLQVLSNQAPSIPNSRIFYAY